MHQFTAGDSFDDPEVRAKFKENVLSISLKFGAMTQDDFVTDGVTFAGPFDLRHNLISNISTIAGVVNLKVAMESPSVPLHTVVANAAAGSVLLIPPHYFVAVTQTVTWRDDIHLVGCGPSSVVSAVTSAGTHDIDLFTLDDISRASFRNFRAVGKRPFAGGGCWNISNCRSADIVIENVIAGPVDESGTSNAFFDPVVKAADSSGIFCTGLHISYCASSGIYLRGGISGTTLTEDVDIRECFIENCEHNISLRECQDIRIIGCKVGFAEQGNFRVNNSTAVVIADCHGYHATTGFPNSFSNMDIFAGVAGQTKNVMVLGNKLRDDKSGFAVTSKHHVVLDAETSFCTIYGNFMGNNASIAEPVIQDSSVGTTRDGNHLHDSYYRVRPYTESGALQYYAQSHPPGDEFSTTFSESFRNNHSAYLSSIPYPGLGVGGDARNRTVYSETGDSADAVPLDLPDAFEKMGNSGSAPTPNRFHSETTIIYDEAAAIHATYNIVQPLADAKRAVIKDGVLETIQGPAGPALFNAGGQPLFPDQQWDDWWMSGEKNGTNVANPSTISGMKHSVLNVNLQTGESSMVIAGHPTFFTSQSLMAHRPTWVALHL
jgi:hypothetical protein